MEATNQNPECPDCGTVPEIKGREYYCSKCDNYFGEVDSSPAIIDNVTPFPARQEKQAKPKKNIPSNANRPQGKWRLNFARPVGNDLDEWRRYTVRLHGAHWSVYESEDGKIVDSEDRLIVKFAVIKGKCIGDEIIYPVTFPKSKHKILPHSNLFKLLRMIAMGRGVGLRELPDFDYDNPERWLNNLSKGLEFVVKIRMVKTTWKKEPKKYPYARVETFKGCSKSKV
jgi:hypothetical protein